MPGNRGWALSLPTSASKRSTSRPASSSISATRSCAARSLPVTDGTRMRSCASRMQSSVSSACSARASARSSITVWYGSGEELLVAKINEVVRHVQQVGESVHKVPEHRAHRHAPPEKEEEKQQGQHPEPIGEDAQFDREPGRDHPETVKGRYRNQVQHHRRDLEEDEESQSRPERESAEWWGTVEHQERPSDQQREDQVAERTRGRSEAAPAIVADSALIEIDSAAGQPDPANQEEHDWQGDAEDGVRVLEWVEREVARGRNRPVTTH